METLTIVDITNLKVLAGFALYEMREQNEKNGSAWFECVNDLHEKLGRIHEILATQEPV